MALDALLVAVFEQETGAMMNLAPWLNTASRFGTFLRTYQDKIRRKARLCQDVEARRDLLAELAVAWLLLQDRQVALEYEKPQRNRKGGPDFTATFKTHTVFNVEVKRLRSGEIERDEDELNNGKWAYAVVDKSRQLLSADYNIIALVVEQSRPVDGLATSMKQLKLRAESKDEAYFHRRGLNVADFFTYLNRLHAIVVCSDGPDVPHVRALWINKTVRRPLPTDLVRVLRSTSPGI